jgi:hypothetical protein
MPQEWYLNTTSPYNSGITTTDMQTQFTSILESTPPADDIELCTSDLITRTEMRAIVQNLTSSGMTSPYERQILAPIGTLRAGKYVYYKSSYWLIVTQPDDNGMYEKATAKLCNLILRWQNASGTIIERYAHQENNLEYITGETSNKTITTTNQDVDIRIPSDSATVLLDRDNRFLFDSDKPTAFRCTYRDTLSGKTNKGSTIKLTLSADELDDNDNTTLMIADYITPVTPPATPTDTTITPNDGAITMGFAKTFAVTFRIDGVEQPDMIPIWSVTSATTGLAGHTTLTPDNTNKTVSVLVKDDLSYSNATIVLSVTEATGVCSASITLTIGGLF